MALWIALSPAGFKAQAQAPFWGIVFGLIWGVPAGVLVGFLAGTVAGFVAGVRRTSD